jgi:hypothetical protein
VDKVAHRGECTEEGSKLTFAGTPAIYACDAEVELTGAHKGGKWDVSLD